MDVLSLRRQHNHALTKAESILRGAETAGRELTRDEQLDIDTAMAAANALEPQLRDAERRSTIRAHFPNGGVMVTNGGRRTVQQPELRLDADYADAFHDYISSNGQRTSAALYEGSGSAGGYVVPVVVQDQVVPLAPPDMGVRSIATVIPTSMDIKIPRATAISTAAAKAEGTGSGSNVFTESEPTLDQFTLSAFMAGVLHQISWELAQDVPSFQQFAVGDMILAQQIYEANLFVNGTGSGQPQGLLGNTGAGITGVLVGSDNYASELLNATFDVQGTLKTQYHPNASWLMSRATSVVLRKAQAAANLFFPVFVRVGNQDYMHGYPVTYDTAMPAIGAGNTPVLFGDFKQGFVIGDRGGSGINVKILDQPKAVEGLIQLLAYRRCDSRVRRTEALQAITLHS
jgi:HK97 family phage major capsid protein